MVDEENKDDFSNKFMDTIEACNYDDNLLKENQVVLINVNREKLACKNIRMNERIFKCDKNEEALGIESKAIKFKDVKNQQFKFKEKSEVVIKLNKQRDLTALELCKQNFYMNQSKAQHFT